MMLQFTYYFVGLFSIFKCHQKTQQEKNGPQKNITNCFVWIQKKLCLQTKRQVGRPDQSSNSFIRKHTDKFCNPVCRDCNLWVGVL